MDRNFSNITTRSNDEEEGGIAKTDQSPVAAVGPLLRFYSWVGLFPASISGDYREFKTQWLRYILFATCCFSLGSVIPCFCMNIADYEENDNDSPESQFIDIMFSHMLEKMYVVSIVFTMYYNHRLSKDLPNLVNLFSEDDNMKQESFFGKCLNCGFNTSIKTNLDQSGINNLDFVPIRTSRKSDKGKFKVVKTSNVKRLPNKNRPLNPTYSLPSAKRPITHHVTILVSTVIFYSLLDTGIGFSEQKEPRVTAMMEAGDWTAIIIMEVSRVTADLYIMALISTPELIADRFLSVLTSRIRQDLANENNLATCDFCARQETHYVTCQKLFKVFGNSLMVLVSFAAAMLVFASYYFCLYTTEKVPTGSETERWLSIAAWAVLSFVAFKRLLHLSNACQELNDAFEDCIEKMIRMEARDNGCTKNVNVVRRLLSRADNNASILGLFSINRGMILVIVGEILTYLVIMLEFNSDEDTGGGTECVCSCE